jgi:hypothetical protein
MDRKAVGSKSAKYRKKLAQFVKEASGQVQGEVEALCAQLSAVMSNMATILGFSNA